jgi:hypothetical protein
MSLLTRTKDYTIFKIRRRVATWSTQVRYIVVLASSLRVSRSKLAVFTHSRHGEHFAEFGQSGVVLKCQEDRGAVAA